MAQRILWYGLAVLFSIVEFIYLLIATSSEIRACKSKRID